MKATKQQRKEFIQNRINRLTSIYLSLPKSGNIQATSNRIIELRSELTNQLKAL